jgi:hypothetical protein
VRPPVDDGITLDLLASNVPAFSVWRLCRKPMLGAGFGAIPIELETVEIEASARVLDLPLDAALLGRIRALDGAFVAEAGKRAGKSK